MPYTQPASPPGSGYPASMADFTFSDYENLVREALRDWGWEDSLNADITATALSLVINNTSFQIYTANRIIQIGDELIRVSDDTISTTIACNGGRGAHGSVASAHKAGTIIRTGLAWSSQQLRGWINEAIDQLYDRLYIRETLPLAGTDNPYTYILPLDLTDSRQVESLHYIDTIGRRHPIFAAEFEGSPLTMRVEFPLSAYQLILQYVRPYPFLAPDSTLAADMTIGGLTMTVATGTGINFTPGFYFTVGTETLLVSGAPTGDVVPVTRAQHGTIAATHLTGATLSNACQLPSAADRLPVLWACYRALSQAEGPRARSSSYQIVQDDRGNPVGSQLNAAKFYRQEFDDVLGKVYQERPQRYIGISRGYRY